MEDRSSFILTVVFDSSFDGKEWEHVRDNKNNCLKNPNMD